MKKNIILTAIGAIIFTFGYPSFLTEKSNIIFSILGTSFLFYCLEFKSKKNDLSLILIFSFVISLLGFYWIPKTVMIFGGLPNIVGLIILFLFSFIVFSFSWPAYFTLNFLQKKYQTKNLNFKVIAIASTLTLFEYFTPTQFPVHLGQGWINSPIFLGLASIFGFPIYSFISYNFSLIISTFIKSRKVPKFTLLINISLLILAFILRPHKQALLENQSNEIKIRVVQANIGNYMKIKSELGQFTSLQEVYNRHYKLSIEDLPEDTDLIIWPETSYPQNINSTTPIRTMPNLVNSVIEQTNTALLFGGYDIGDIKKSQNQFQTVYNSAFLYNSDKSFNDVYHKHLLIPFGETIPFGPFNTFLKDYIPGVSYFSQGHKKTVFSLGKDLSFMVPICYEVLSSSFIRSMLQTANKQRKQPNFLVNLTNDSWYGKTAEPFQHLFLMKWRAVEFQIPIIRSTNSGITSLIGITGEESKRLTLGEVKSLDLKLNANLSEVSFYQHYGISLFMILSIILLLISFFSRYIKKNA